MKGKRLNGENESVFIFLGSFTPKASACIPLPNPFPTWPRALLHKILSLLTIFPKMCFQKLPHLIHLLGSITPKITQIYIWLSLINYLGTYNQGLTIQPHITNVNI